MGRAPTNAETIALRRLFFRFFNLSWEWVQATFRNGRANRNALSRTECQTGRSEKENARFTLRLRKGAHSQISRHRLPDDACEDGPPVTEGFTILVGNFPIRRAVLGVWPTGTGISCVPGPSGHTLGTKAALERIYHVDFCEIFEVIPWKKLTSKSSEIAHSQKDLKFSFDSQGSVKVATKMQSPDAKFYRQNEIQTGLKSSSQSVRPCPVVRLHHHGSVAWVRF